MFDQTFDSYIQESCDSVLKCISESGLNYVIQATPYSVYITMRKSLTNTCRNKVNLVGPKVSQNDCIASTKRDQDLETFQKRCKFLENSNENLKDKFEDSVKELESSLEYIKNLENKVETLQKNKDPSN